MNSLSVFGKYIIRKILSKYRGRLRSVVIDGASPEISTVCDLDAALADLYLEEDSVKNAIAELEHLTQVYKRLETEPIAHPGGWRLRRWVPNALPRSWHSSNCGVVGEWWPHPCRFAPNP